MDSWHVRLTVLLAALALLAGRCPPDTPPPEDRGPVGNRLVQRLEESVRTSKVLALPDGVPAPIESPKIRLAEGVPAGLPIPWEFRAELQTAAGELWQPPPDLTLEPSELPTDCLPRDDAPIKLPTGIPTGGKTNNNDAIKVPLDLQVDWSIEGFFEGEATDEYALGSIDALRGRPTETQSAANIQTFTMFPAVIELGDRTGAPRFLKATVRLIARLDQTPELDEEREREACGLLPPEDATVEASTNLPPLPLPNFVVAIPTILGLAEHPRFGGGVLLLVPGRLKDFFQNDAASRGTSQVTALSNQVQDLLTVLQQQQVVLRDMRGRIEAATWFLNLFAGLEVLNSIVVGAPEARLTLLNDPPYLNEIRNLNVDDPSDGAPYQEAFSLRTGINDTEANDEVSALFILGAGPQGVQFFSDEGFEPGEGQLDVVLQGFGFFVAVPNLHFTNFTSPSLIDSPGDIGSRDRRTVGSGEVKPCAGHVDTDDYGDSFSSLRFVVPNETCQAAQG